jgi:hypothetical protein
MVGKVGNLGNLGALGNLLYFLIVGKFEFVGNAISYLLFI